METTYVNNSTGVLKKVLVCSPENVMLQPINVIAQKWIDHGALIDVEACKREHAEFVDAYRANGVEVVFAEAKKELTNQTFARDFGACIREGYILGSFVKPIRFGETVSYEETMHQLGVPCVIRCEEGHFEGGDFWFLDDQTIAIGIVARTDEAGYANVGRRLNDLGYETIAVHCPPDNLHLDMCFNIVAEKTAVICKEAMPKDFLALLKDRGYTLIDIPQEEVFLHHCNLQALGNGRVMSFAANRRVNEQLKALGLEVAAIHLSEILKMGGGPHCMTFPLLRV